MSGLEIVEDGLERASNSIGDVAAATGVDPPADRPSAGRRGRMHARMEWAVPAWSDILQWDHRRSHGDRGSSPRWPRRTRPTAPGAWTRPSTFQPARPESGTNPDDAPESRVGQAELFRRPSGEGGGTP